MNLTKVLPFLLMSIVVMAGIIAVVAITLTVVTIRALTATIIITPALFLLKYYRKHAVKNHYTKLIGSNSL